VKPLLIAVLALTLTGCAAPPAPTDELEGTVTVFAAASLTDSFADIAAAFNEEHPNVNIVFSFGGSSALATQIAEGAPADVFAAASPATMTASGATGENFASNTLEIAVPNDNPGAVKGLADFANADLDIALCAVEVPCGAAAAKVFTATGITASVDTYEQDVKAVLTKVSLGEVDAGLVYKTDVIAASGDVTGIEFPESSEAVNEYPIAAITDTDAARAFVEFVLSKKGQSILAAAGFAAP
jgi:molybdate transport system substrate-binding protein